MVSPEKIEEYYLIGDVFVSASQSETQGLTYMEAMVSGLPLLCREDECLTDVIENGTNGYLYKDKEDFIEMLKVLWYDKENRISMGQKARRTVLDHFSEGAFVKSCEKLYVNTVSDFSHNFNRNLVSV